MYREDRALALVGKAEIIEICTHRLSLEGLYSPKSQNSEFSTLRSESSEPLREAQNGSSGLCHTTLSALMKTVLAGPTRGTLRRQGISQNHSPCAPDTFFLCCSDADPSLLTASFMVHSSGDAWQAQDLPLYLLLCAEPLRILCAC